MFRSFWYRETDINANAVNVSKTRGVGRVELRHVQVQSSIAVKVRYAKTKCHLFHGGSILINRDSGTDISVSISNGRQSFLAFEPTSTEYELVVTSTGTDNDVSTVQVTAVLPDVLQNVRWSCEAGDSASCSSDGEGSISDTITLPTQGSVIYRITADVPPTASSISVNVSATRDSTDGDINAANNQAIDIDAARSIIVSPTEFTHADDAIQGHVEVQLPEGRVDTERASADAVTLFSSQSATLDRTNETVSKSSLGFSVAPFPGEVVSATIGSVPLIDNQLAEQPQIWQFTTPVSKGTGEFGPSRRLAAATIIQDQSLDSFAGKAGDLNGDGHLDLFIFTPNQSNVWINEESIAICVLGDRA